MTTENGVADPAIANPGDGQQNADGANPQGTGTQVDPGKPDDTTQQPAEVVYKFTAPEGIVLDQVSQDEFAAIAKELKLPADAAQKVVDLAVKREQGRIEAHQTMVNGWADTVRADKDLGGDKLAETLATAGKAINLGPPELKELLNGSGLGNHPAVVKWAYTIGKALSEDRFVTGAAPKPLAGSGDEARAQRLYGGSTATA